MKPKRRVSVCPCRRETKDNRAHGRPYIRSSRVSLPMMNIMRVIDSMNRTIIVILLQKVAVYTGFCRPACKRSTVSVIPQPQGWTVTRKRRMLECRIGGLVEVDGNVVLVPQRFVDSQHHVFLIHSRVLSSGTSSVPGFQILLARAMPLRYFVRGDFGYRLQGYRVIVHHGALCGSGCVSTPPAFACQSPCIPFSFEDSVLSGCTRPVARTI